MKKIVALIFILVLFFVFSIGTVSGIEKTNKLEDNTENNIVEQKEKVQSELDKYIERYGSESYGYTGYVLAEVIRPYSIPLCFIGIVIGALYQYVIGTRRLDIKHKGFGLIIVFVTLLVICQVLPLIYTVIVLGWGG